MSKELSAKEILKRQKHQEEFALFQLMFIQYLDKGMIMKIKLPMLLFQIFI
jgi:hypothetical protein